MGKRYLFIVLIVLITFPISCSLERDNIYDELGPGYIYPEISFNETLTSIKDQDTIYSDTITIVLKGNNNRSLFQIKFDDELISVWQSEGYYGAGNLLEGNHVLYIDSKYEGGQIIVSDTLHFYVSLKDYKPKFEIKTDTIIESYEKKFLCFFTPIKGIKPIRYVWLKEGKVLSYKDNDTLFFKPFLKKDTASYRCIAKNEYGIDTSRIFKLVYRPSEGVLKGVIIDSSSKVIKDVKVMLIPSEKEIWTNSIGQFEFSELPEESYTLKIVHEGYKTRVIEGIDINDSEEVAIDKIKLYNSKKSSYKIVYDANGADKGSVPVDSIIYDINSKVIVLENKNNLYLEGYIFIGWNTEKNGKGKCFNPNDSFNINDNFIFYAQWKAKQYLLAFDGNNYTSGEIPNDILYNYNEKVKISDKYKLEREGYYFIGWNTKKDGSGDRYNIGDIIIIDKNVDLFAQWEMRARFKVIYNGNGADDGEVPIDEGSYYKDEEIIILGNTGNLSREGYSFVGWNIKKDGTGKTYSTGSKFLMLDTTTIFFAQWTKNKLYKIIYHGNGNDEGTVPASIALDSGSLLIIPDGNTLGKTGNIFVGWNTEEDGTGKKYYEGDDLVIGTDNIELYAQWKESQYTVIYYGNGHTGGEVPPTTKHLIGSGIETANSGSMVKEGFTFYCWNTDSLGEGVDCFPGALFKNITHDIVLYARWIKNSYVITFKFDNGEKDSTLTVNYGEIIEMEKSPLKSGYVFNGWTIGKNCTELYDFSKEVKEPLALYASWIIRDIDGNRYTEVKIGNQVWMVENLRTTRYNDGTKIDCVEYNTLWENLSTGAFCWWNNDSLKYKTLYGALYNWYAVYSKRLAPKGWHVPTSEEWEILIDYLGGKSIAGGKLKEPGIEHWAGNNPVISESITGFQGLPGGERFDDGTFYNLGSFGSWWSFTPGVPNTAFSYSLSFGNTEVFIEGRSVNLGLSVRCIKD
jgi:uncharacterized protein (TIGR02145 family)/uncharacterized repeat protein (TIGR02543 family)